MKTIERRAFERAARMYRGMLRDLAQMGPASESAEDVEAFGHVKDQILDRIEAVNVALGDAS